MGKQKEDGTVRSIVQLSMEYRCQPPQLWQALTDPRALAEWMGPMTGRAGGMHFGAAACTVLAAEPHARLQWRWRDAREGRTFVITWRIERIATGCRLRFEQREATLAEAHASPAMPAITDEAVSGDGSFRAGADRTRLGDVVADDDADAAGDLPGIAPDEVQVDGELLLTAA